MTRAVDKDDFQTQLARALEASIELTDTAKRKEIERCAAERLHELVRAVAGMKRAKARTRFGWSCLFVSLVVVAIAEYMRVDGKQADSLVALMLSLVPLVGGGWHIHRANIAERDWASALERLESATLD